MTPEQIEIVQDTWSQIESISTQAAQLFYERLFELDPSLRTLFNNDIEKQGKKLVAMIGIAVGSLNKVDALVPAVQALGRRHASYGVRPEHFDTVGTALLWTLEQGLGPSFTPQAREAWATVYETLASTMKAAPAEQAA